jgi:predicted KAP-like P-loop ATPase
MKLALVCKVCDEITWQPIEYLVMSSKRRFHVCIDCINEWKKKENYW